MKFHDYDESYSALKSQMNKSILKATTPGNLLRAFLDSKVRDGSVGENSGFSAGVLAESCWHDEGRPFYNVWPMLGEILMETSLGIPIEAFTLPHTSMLIRLPHDQTLIPEARTILLWRLAKDSKKKSAVSATVETFWIGLYGAPPDAKTFEDYYCLHTKCVGNVGETVEDMEDRVESGDHLWSDAEDMSSEELKRLRQALRLCCGISIMANDPEWVQPRVLAKDKRKFEEGGDEARAKLIEKATRRTKMRGFDVGEKFEGFMRERNAASPHARRPHMALYWTGKGRTVPVLKLRKGSFVNAKQLTEVPSGYLGEHDDD